MNLSAWVLVIFFKVGYGAGAVAIDMPDYQTCKRESATAKDVGAVHTSFCVSRTK